MERGAVRVRLKCGVNCNVIPALKKEALGIGDWALTYTWRVVLIAR
jgi:hypothetical protein